MINKVIRWMEHLVVILSFIAIARLLKELFDVLTKSDDSSDSDPGGTSSYH